MIANMKVSTYKVIAIKMLTSKRVIAIKMVSL